MLAKQACRTSRTLCRGFASAATTRPVTLLPDSTIETFRKQAFEPAVPALLPRSSLTTLPAVSKWFSIPAESSRAIKLNDSYLSPFGSAIVPLEITAKETFNRVHQPLSFFLEASALALFPARVYLAQASLADLPQQLREDVPTPDLVLKTGKGDVYDTSIWLGRAPTYTSLHRDPNPNLFVQLAGKKIVRLFRPEAGNAIFARVQERIGGSASAAVRGEEMMQGVEKEALEEAVWGEGTEGQVWQAELGRGDGLFIPKGWWHSIKGMGESMTGSVNWWFR